MTKNYIPTINISSLIKEEFKTQNALKIIKKIEKACVEVGFFQVTGHGINIKKINNICKIGNRFFNSSEKNKNKYLYVVLDMVMEMQMNCYDTI